MRSALKLKSKSGIHRLITGLEERGYIRRLAYRAKSLEEVRLAQTLRQVAGGDAIDDEDHNVVSRTFSNLATSSVANNRGGQKPSEGGDLARAGASRVASEKLPASVYVSSSSLESARKLFKHTKAFLVELGYDLEEVDDWKRGSWFRRAVFSIKHFLTKGNVKDRIRMAENILYGRQKFRVEQRTC